MTFEELEIYRKIQDKKGDWQLLDRCAFVDKFGTVVAVYDDEYIEIYFDDDSPGTTWKSKADDPDLLWIPPEFSKDDRCLWKIAACGHFLHVYWYPNGCTMIKGMGVKTMKGDSLSEALLKVIAAREGVTKDSMNSMEKKVQQEP